jgi:hypothetical protein
MSVARYISDLAGTLRSAFRIGVNKLINVSSVLTSQTNAGVNAPIAMSQVQLKAASAAGMVSLKSPDSLATELAFTMPAADGSTDQALVTNASGVLSFKTVATGSNAVKAEDQAVVHGDSGALPIITLPAGATVQRITVEVNTPFDGTGPAPSLSVGLVGSVSKYMSATELDLGVAGIYEVEPMIEEAGIVSPIVTFIQGGGHSAGAATVTLQWVVPG